MARMTFLLVMALVGASAREDSPAGRLPSPELPDISFPSPHRPDLQASPECPVGNCWVGPESLTRDRKAPARFVSEFLAPAGEHAELVLVTSDRKRTTVRAWLNEQAILLPSALARGGSNEVRIPVILADQNVLEVRLAAKPGIEVTFWIEGEESSPPPPSAPALEFRLSNGSVEPSAVMNEVCSTDHGPEFQIADWEDVVAGIDPTPIQQAGTAWIQRNGIGSISFSFFGPTFHYLVSAIGNLSPTYHYATIEPDLFWLNAATGARRVLCKGPPSS